MPNRTRSSAESAWLPQMIATIDEGMVLTDVQGRTTWVNPGVTRLCGYPLADLRGRPPGKETLSLDQRCNRGGSWVCGLQQPRRRGEQTHMLDCSCAECK